MERRERDGTDAMVEDAPECGARWIVVAERATLAGMLRAQGWLAAAGWQGVDDDGAPVRFVRFERPADESA